MPISFRCNQCRRTLAANDRYAGARIKCPGCGAAVVVPHPEQDPTVRSLPGRRDRGGAEPGEEPPVAFDEQPAVGDEVDMTPMIDCVFLLLIFFIVTASFALQKSIEVPPPEQENETARTRTIDEILEDPDLVIVRIDRESTIWVDEAEVVSRQELLARLRAARAESREDGGAVTSLLVMADGDARHEAVVMALDAGNVVGMESVRLATVDDEDL